MLRFAVVTDIHYGFDRGNKKGSRAPALIDRFIKAANANRVDFAVDMGDRVTFTNPVQDRHYLIKLRDQFNKFAMPKYSVHGNHDVTHLTREENDEILGLPGGSYSKDIQDHHVVFWNPNVKISKLDGLYIKPEDMEWLRDTLAKTDKKCIVFSHIPLDNYPEDNTAALEHDQRPFLSYYPQGPDVRQIMEESGKVILCMAGHRHRNRHRDINGIHYITHQSLVQRYHDTQRAHAAYSLIKIDKDRIQIEGRGLGQPSYDLKAA
ncbi:MAG: metallophosphoesterase family protein [Micavibrio sp.]